VAAPIKGLDTSTWFSAEGLRELASAYGNAALAGAGWGLLGASVALVLRSVLPTLGVVLVWFFPAENILHNNFSDVDRWFPGLLLQGLNAGGSYAADWQRTFTTIALYVAAAVAVSAWTFTRRDVTA